MGTGAAHGAAAVMVEFSGVDVTGGGAKIDFQGTPGRSYEVQRSTDLANWSVLATVVAGPTGVVGFTDEDPPEGSGFSRLPKP